MKKLNYILQGIIIIQIIKIPPHSKVFHYDFDIFHRLVFHRHIVDLTLTINHDSVQSRNL